MRGRITMCAQYPWRILCPLENEHVSPFVCVFTPCSERLVEASPCFVHWGAAICSSNGKWGVWHWVWLMTLLILWAARASKPPAGSSHYWPVEGDNAQYKLLCASDSLHHQDVFIQKFGRLRWFTCSLRMCRISDVTREGKGFINAWTVTLLHL